MINPPEFVFANVHGELQVKMTRRSKRGLFIPFNSVQNLVHIINNAQGEGKFDHKGKNFDNVAEMVADDWADSDDYGFGLFD